MTAIPTRPGSCGAKRTGLPRSMSGLGRDSPLPTWCCARRRRGTAWRSRGTGWRGATSARGAPLARPRLAADDAAAGVLVRPMGELSVVIESAYWLVLPSNRSLRPAAQAVVDWLQRATRAGYLFPPSWIGVFLTL